MDTVITFAEKTDEGRLKRLFLNSFDDTLGFVNMLFSHHFIPENTVVAKSGDNIIGMALLLSGLVDGQNCYYLYGLCVDTALRSCGIGTKILEFAKCEAKNRNAMLCLHPENRNLFAFYEKSGFSPCGIRKIHTEKRDGTDSAVLLSVSAEEYAKLRFEANLGGFGWSEDGTAYALGQEEFFGGSYFATVLDGKKYILLINKSGDTVTVLDTTLPDTAITPVANALCLKFASESVNFVLPPQSKLGETEICALGVGFSKPVYMNLLLE